jgi:hypothetical protein
MDQIIINRKKQIQNEEIIQLSQLGIAAVCDYIICDRFYENLNISLEDAINNLKNIKYGDKLYLNYLFITSDYIQNILNILKEKNIKVIFYIMVEPKIDTYIIDFILPYSLNIYIQNNLHDHRLIYNLPIGIRNGEEVLKNHKGYSQFYLINEGLKKSVKNILCLLCFSYSHEERYRCYNILKDKTFILNLNDGKYEKQTSKHCGKVPVSMNYEITHRSYYVLSPSGSGEATHRFFEAIYLNSIPIVKKTSTAFDKLYDIFPCMIINDWDEIAEEHLENNKEKYLDLIKVFKTKYPNWCYNIDEIIKIISI